MNTKKRNIGARLGAMLLSLCLMMGLLPTTAFAQDTGTTIFGYEGSGTWSMASVSAEDQSDYTALTSYDSFDWFYGLEMIGDTIYGVYCGASSGPNSHLVILNPDLTIKETVGTWNMGEFGSPDYIEQIVDTTVQNGTLWGTYNKAEYNWDYDDDWNLVSTFKSGTSYLIPIDLTTGMADKTQIHQVTGLPEREIIYTIACNADGKMYAIVADGGEDGGTATLYTIDTASFKATKVGSTGVTTNYVSSSTFAPDGTLYWAENNAGKLYTVNTATGKATAVYGGTIGGSGLSLNAMMIPSNADEVAYVNFVVNGEGTVTMDGKGVSGWQKVTPGDDLSLTFTPGGDSNVKQVVVDGEKMEFIDSYTLKNVSAWSVGAHTVEVTFGSRDISINADQWGTQYLGTATLEYHPSFEAGLYFTVSNGPSRKTAAGVSNYEISIEKDGKTIDKSDLVPGTYDIHVTRAEDKYWNALDIVLKDDLIITKQTDLIQWSDLELTANPGDTLADIEKPAYLVSPLDGKQIPGTFYWIDAESTSVGELGDRTGFTFRFVPDLPLSAELAARYDFSAMPEDGFQGDEWNPYTAYVTVKEASDIPSSTDPIDLPVRVLEEGDTDYSPAPELSAAFTPDSAVTAGEFNEFQGLAIDYRKEDTEKYGPVSEGYDFQAIYTVTIPLENYRGSTLSGTLTIPLPEGYDGATARIKGGASASSYTATTVSFPVTMDVSGGVAEKFELVIEYKEAQESNAPVITSGANSTWQKGGTDGLSFTSNAAFADFIKVQVDGKDLDASSYTVKEGSTIVTLKPEYLETLSVGKHTLAIVSDTGTASTDFTIKAAASDDTQSPQTGNSSNMMLWITLLFVSGTGLFGATAYNRKKKYNQ